MPAVSLPPCSSSHPLPPEVSESPPPTSPVSMLSEVEERCSVTRRKRKRERSEPKLLVGSRVEVRSLEDGLLGSWYAGTVIAWRPQMRDVRYDSCLAEGGSSKLEESVPVSMAIDGLDCGNRSNCSSYRGHIRPVPPSVAIGTRELLYGLCVDVYHEDAWWEGVIFDRSIDAKERNVFFPDLGDELLTHISNIRIAQDWIEGEDNWVRRGFWSFLKVIHEYEEQFYLPVSVKQIWYDLRQTKGFRKIKEWTCSKEILWKNMVFSVLVENIEIALSCISPTFNLDKESAREEGAVLQFFEPPSELHMKSETDASSCLSILPVDEPLGLGMTGSNTNSTSDAPLTVIAVHKPVVGLFQVRADAQPAQAGTELKECVSVVENKVPHISLSKNKNVFSDDEIQCVKSGCWRPVAPELVPEPEFFPDALESYLADHVQHPWNSARMAVKRHLAYLGWKMECKMSGKMNRIRYVSPDGKCYRSLILACQSLCRNAELNPAVSSEDANKSLITLPRNEDRIKNSKVSEDSFPSEGMTPDDRNITRACCPQAVCDYYSLELEQSRKASGVIKELRLKTKEQLRAIGWELFLRDKEGKRETVYQSPRGRLYFSLRRACKGCIQDGRSQQLKAGTVDHVIAGEEVEAKSPSKKLSLSVGRVPHQKALLPLKRNKKPERNRMFRHLKNDTRRPSKLRIKFPGALAKVGDEMETSRSSCALRSCKKVQKTVPRHFLPNSKTLLSWLIDKNILLPRAKVYCCSDSSGSSFAEGRIHRDGIRCNCCNDLLTLNGFVSHSGGTNCSPAAIICLEDGRSLLDCQVQILHEKKRSHVKEDPADGEIHKSHVDTSAENDYLCSICHYGGDLILCDQCPSSYHGTCLGLKGVPDGDWYCPSCCCAICGEGNLSEDIGLSTDVSIINCSQCKRKYHTVCLRKRRGTELGDHGRGNWYCSRKCEQIHVGLLELEGKQIRLGMDNLTFTMLKPVDYERHDDVDLQMKSELNRLNFRGFYTVLLEKNDELITVATIRIHREVAEVPLVGTRFQFRRLGMCHALMNTLEKKLKELGVERIVLPAVPSALNTWTGSFGFTKMTDLEKLHFVNHTFLNFQDTTVCQKRLLDGLSGESRVSSGLLQKLADHLHEAADIELNGLSSVSEEFLGKAVDGSKTVEQGTIDFYEGTHIAKDILNVAISFTGAATRDIDESSNPVDKVGQINESAQLDSKQSFTKPLPECSIADAESDQKDSVDGSRVFRYYYRRRRPCKESR
ncbi:hypothetical protein CRG98_007367 [Punica granatum]|uniref:Increased DNA methylation 1 n=1 Tax=Punica granatum TaxID=22663 RepID=A0A2I0KV78_PUNGR|nr:hypothetical protein CRG98_007367 [Punica granatum]